MMGKLTREECATGCVVFERYLDALRAADPNGRSADGALMQAAAYLRADADLAARLAAVEAERDALAEQVASCRKALEWLRDRTKLWGSLGGLRDTRNLESDQTAPEWYAELFAATGVPVAHLTGKEAGE